MKKLVGIAALALAAASCGSQTADEAETTTPAVEEGAAATSLLEVAEEKEEATESTDVQDTKNNESESEAQKPVSKSAISSGKVEVKAELDNIDGMSGQISMSIVKQDKNVEFYFDGSQIDHSDPEDEVEEMRLIRIGDVVYESVEDNKWREGQFGSYSGDDIFYPLYNDEGKYDLQPVVDLLDKAGPVEQTNKGSEQKYSGMIDVQKVSIEGHPAAQFPPGLDIMLHGIGIEDARDSVVLDVAVYSQDGLLKKIVINAENVDSGGEIALTSTFSELGESQMVEAPAENLVISEGE